MKKTVPNSMLIAGYFLLMSSLGIIAAVPGNIQKASKENVRREIIRNIPCPAFLTENSEANEVRAIVQINENGSVSVSEINSANPELKDYVVSALREMKVHNAGTTEKFVLIIKFKIA